MLEKRILTKSEFIIILGLISLIAMMYGGLFALRLNLFRTVIIDGESMTGTMETGGKAFIVSNEFNVIQRGDIVSTDIYLDNKKTGIVKRIVGLPNETIKIINNRVYIDGRRLDEDYVLNDGLEPHRQIEFVIDNKYIQIIKNQIYVNDTLTKEGLIEVRGFQPKFHEVKLEDDQYFIIGDNRNNSYDSRNFGPVRRRSIKSTIVFYQQPKNEELEVPIHED